ncbi:MAG: alpha-L-fucosidase [Bryobacteraceae bacterium]
MTRRSALIAMAGSAQAWRPAGAQSVPEHTVGPFQPTFESLTAYRCPEWFRDAKFGIWAHWGPQSVPMFGDWYARKMYEEGGKAYEHHLKTYGHPSKFGYKDIIPRWKAEKFDPDRLIAHYKAAGARYFVSMGVHHDNFDLWNSKHHRWNAVQMGPKRDIVGAWRKAALGQGLKFGVSEHLGASYTWFQASHGSDKNGSLAGVPYDGANPQWENLYHSKAKPGDTAWYSTDPSWAREWFGRITDLVDQYQPDLLYTDGSLPFGEIGRSMLAHFYNANMARHGGKLEAVYNLKDWRTRPGHGDYVEGIGVQDVERGGLSSIKPASWQTDTAIGDWFYNKNWKAKDTGTMYRSAKWVIHTLVDVVSKNGNMLLNVIQRPDGSLDPEVEQLLDDLTAWMKINGEAIHSTRPWTIYGEGKTQAEAGHFKEDFAFSAEDIRFTQSKDGQTLYAVALGWPPDGQLRIRALKKPSGGGNQVDRVELLGHAGRISFQQSAEELLVKLPSRMLSPVACTLKIVGQKLHPPA